VGPPRQAEMQARCSSGLLRKIFLEYKTHDCACRHELAVNGLTDPRLRFQDITTLGQGGFGTVYRSRCNKTRKEYAIKTAKPVSSDCWKEGRSSVWRRLVFRNLYSLPKVWRWCRDRYVYAWGKLLLLLLLLLLWIFGAGSVDIVLTITHRHHLLRGHKTRHALAYRHVVLCGFNRGSTKHANRSANIYKRKHNLIIFGVRRKNDSPRTSMWYHGH